MQVKKKVRGGNRKEKGEVCRERKGRKLAQRKNDLKHSYVGQRGVGRYDRQRNSRDDKVGNRERKGDGPSSQKIEEEKERAGLRYGEHFYNYISSEYYSE